MTQPLGVVTRRDQLAVTGPVFRDFTAKLMNMEFPVENDRPKTKLQFTEMNVHKSVAAYPHPTGELVMNRVSQNGGQPSDRSIWGRLLISSDEQGYPDILELIGHTLHMVSSENTIEADAKRGTEAGSFITWKIVAVDGVDNRQIEETVESTPPPSEANGTGEANEETLMSLIHGKTIGEFTVAALNLSLPAALRARLLDQNDLIPSWLQRGQVTTDGNIYTLAN